jgi:hemerythrin-like domain-containing protein
MAATKTTKKAAPKKAAGKTTTTRNTAARRAPPRGTLDVKNYEGKTQRQPEAIAFLMQQHREVEAEFKAFENAASEDEKQAIANRICLALKVHTQIEEELLYPPAHESLSDEDLVDEAYVEHEGAKRLVADIERMQPGDHCYDAKVKVLSEYIKHHVKEEETELFPEIKSAKLDLAGLAPQLKARSAELEKALADQRPVHALDAAEDRKAAPYLA